MPVEAVDYGSTAYAPPSGVRAKECLACGKRFLVGPRFGRIDKTHCSDKCRAAAAWKRHKRDVEALEKLAGRKLRAPKPRPRRDPAVDTMRRALESLLVRRP